jgi:cytochrome b
MDSALVRVRVWDLPTRVFHWLLAAAVIAAVVTAKVGGNAMVWHTRLGLLVLALLAFRIVWGLGGGYWSRFARFVYAPATVLRYLRGQAAPGEHLDVGHNPLGALSVFALLGVLAAQVGTGLIADDEIATTGPLIRFVSSAASGRATSWHGGPGQGLILLLVVLHVGAIVFYRVRRGRDLVGPMLAGDKMLPASVPGTTDGAATRLAALVLAAGCGALAWWIDRLGNLG